MNDVPKTNSAEQVCGAPMEVDRPREVGGYFPLVMDRRIVSRRKIRLTQRILKRTLDVLVSGSSLVVLSPILILTAVAIKLTSRGPVFYPWDVIGLEGRPFRSYKLRSMVVGADELKESLLHLNEMTGPVFKITRDPRVTRVGRFIRKFSIDEFPQLWSVLKGDMSLVGPRPVGPREWTYFEEWQRRKLSVTPGMISLWHVNGKPKDFEEWIKKDLEYIDTWSFWLDLNILAKGALYVLLGKSC